MKGFSFILCAASLIAGQEMGRARTGDGPIPVLEPQTLAPARVADRGPALELYVAPTGSDSNRGSGAQPFATLSGARDALRSMRAKGRLGPGGITVWLRGGYYDLAAGVRFDSEDSGTAESPIVYASALHEEAHLTGATRLDPNWFTVVNDRSPVWNRLDAAAHGNVYSVNLTEHGISDLGTLKPRGFDLRANAPLELFFNGEPMTLARWPNAGELLARTASSRSPKETGYDGDRPSRWSHATDIWIHGLWSQDWADFHLPVAGVDPETRTFTLASPPAQYGIGSRRPYYAYNLLEELDVPGEYYVDRAAGVLYFWPPAPLRGSLLQASMLEAPLLVLNATRYLTFRGLTLEATRGPLLIVRGGDHNAVDTCILRNCGQFGAQISGTQNGIARSRITGCGQEGVRLEGGDRPSLTPGGNTVTHSRIQGSGRIDWTYKPGIAFVGGCGNSATYNLLEDMPHAAILFSGNNHRIAYNEIARVCQETSDSGAIGAGRNWGYRGNVIEYNYVHDIASRLPSSDVNGVYLDDCLSGVRVFANVFYRISGTAIFCGGGRDNLISNNVIGFCGVAHHNDDRGRRMVTDKSGDSWNLLESLRADGVFPEKRPWASAYPECAALPDSWMQLQQGLWLNPQNCVFSHNVGWGNAAWTSEYDSSGTGVFEVYASMEDNSSAHAALFDPAAAEDRALRPAFLTSTSAGFLPLPFAAIGPGDSEVPPPALAPTEPAAPVLVAKNTTRIEAENPLTVVKDQAINGSIGVSRGTLDSGGSVRVYDKGDAIRVRFSIAASGAYQIGLRVRSGGSTGTTSFWPDGYAAQLDGAPAALAGDPNTLSARDPAFGGAYWGTMISGPLTLAAGEHSLVITAEASWGLVDYVEVTTLVPATGGTTAASPPTGRAWTHGDIGAVGVTGTTRQQRDTFTLTGSGADIWDATVGFQYARQSANGDGAVTARIEALQDSDPWAKAGVMMRASLDPQAAFAAVYATPENGIAFQWRPAEGAPCDSVRGPGVRAPYWARVVRTGGVFTGYISSDGSRWIALGAATIAMESAVSVGLAVTSHAYSTPATAVFGSVGIRFSGDSPGAASAAAVPAAAILPTAGDIGSVSTAGSSVLTGGEYRITGCGADIWNTAVGFQFARQIWTGDTVITARIKTLDDTDAWAKAGVMIRASADANAPFAGIYATPESGVVFQWRPATGIECSSTPASTVPIPCWVRLARVGDTFTAYASADGRTWTVLGTTPIAMAPEVAVGLAVTSHNPSKAASSTMDSVTLVGAEP